MAEIVGCESISERLSRVERMIGRMELLSEEGEELVVDLYRTLGLLGRTDDSNSPDSDL